MASISHRLDLFDSSDFQRAMQKQAEMVDPIDLSIGVPEELTPEHIKAAGIRAIQSDKTVYTPTAGIAELRAALAHKLTTENNIPTTPEAIAVVPGLTTGQLLVYMALLDPGDEVIIFDPYYPPYPHLASMIGANPVCVSVMPDYQPDLYSLELSITDRTKAIVVNSPNNPTGAVYPESTLRKIAKIAAKHDLVIISDEIYEHFCYDTPHFSIGSIYPNTLTLNGFSKEYAMTGWRLGYVSGPQEIINAINQLQQYMVFSTSSIAQHAGLAAIEHRPSVMKKYLVKRNYLIERLENMGYTIYGAEGAFYIFIKVPHGITDVEFVEKASDEGLILVPGRAFSNWNGFVRISYGASMETLERGMDVLEKITRNMHN